MNKKNIWCPLPWSHFGVKNNGTLRICSHSQSAGTGHTVLYHNNKPLTIENLNDVDILNTETLKAVRKNFISGKWPSQCKRCEIENKSRGLSRNERETAKHLQSLTKEEALANTTIDGTIKNPKLLTLDLRVGHQCNLRCTMCFPGESTKWYKDYFEIIQEKTFDVDGKIYDLDIKNADFSWAKSDNEVNNLIKVSKYLKKIKFGGGEPLMLNHCYELIKKLVDAGYSKNIELEYSSNLTIFPEKLWDLWKHFRKIVICASIDAYGEPNEAIRYPSKWNNVEHNIDMLDNTSDNTSDNIVIFTSTTISILSLEHYADLMLWLDSKNFKKINTEVHNFDASHPVYYPRYLNISILEKKDFYEIINLMKRKIELSKSIKKEKMLGNIKYYEQFYENMKTPRSENIMLYRRQFADRFFRFEKKQNQNWRENFPMSYKVAKKWSL